MTWALSTDRRRPGDMLNPRRRVPLAREPRAPAQRCGAELGGAPDLVRLEQHSPRVYRVPWPLSDGSGGHLPPRPAEAPAASAGGRA